jgi:hypothetical protein
MPSASSKLDILITAKDSASGPIKQIEGSLKGLDSAASTLASGMSGLLGAAGIAGVGALVQQLGSAAVEMTQMAAEADRLGAAFDNLAGQAGQSGDAILKAMQEASRGTVSNTELMASANRAMLLGVADSASEMAQLMEVAAARGKAMGETTSQAFSDLVTGIGRMSPMILDNLGITIDAQAAFDAYAKSIGTTADQLDDAQKKQVILNTVIQTSSQMVKDNATAGLDLADNFERYAAAVTNAKVALGEAFSGPAAAALQIMTAYIAGQTKMLENEKGAFESVTVAAKNFATGGHDVTSATMEMAQAEGKADAITKNLTFGMLNLGDAATGTGHKLREMGADARAAMEQFNIAMQTSQDIARQISSAATQAGVLFGAKQGGDVGLARQKAVNDELTAQNQKWLDMHYTQKQIDDVLMPAYIQNLNEANQATFKVATGTAQISDAAQEAQQAFDDLKGKVASVLQGALNVGVGVDPQKVLEGMGFPREDAINENARRLADIAANGLKNQDWLGEFQKEVPDIWKMIRLAQNPQEEAARLLQDFQDGLLTSPIDKGKAKEIVRRQIMGDQNMADFANEIAQELASEMGIPLQEAMAATQKTLGGGAGLGSEAATQFADGASQALDEAAAGGGAFVTKFTDQMRAQYSLLSTAGKDAGKLWGSGFLAAVGDNVPAALISLLVNLVTPGVMASFAQRGTLTGAVP